MQSQKVPNVPPLPPSLVLDLESGRTIAANGQAQAGLSTNGRAASGTGLVNQQQSEAAALAARANAAHAAAQPIPKPVGQQRRKMLEAMSNARLDVAQTRDLVRLCAQHIRERGLETLGLFRSFRVAESTDRIEYLIQLYLISINPSAYASVFPVLPENALKRLSQRPEEVPDKSRSARNELEKEIRYASPHDAAAMLKWGLRHMRVRNTDFNSPDEHGWYDNFVKAERASQYHPRAIADLLHPNLPLETAELLSEVLELMATVASHRTANHMPASYICRVLGFWLLGRIGVAHPPPTFDEFHKVWEKSSAILEHLLLAHIRSQAAVTFSMPLRLTEMVEGYPYLAEGATTPSLPPAFASRPIHTLRVDLRTENLVVSQTKPRSPSATLAAALDAKAAETLEGGRGETWAMVMAQLEDSAVDHGKGTELLIDEHSRIFNLVDKELAAREELRKEADEKNRFGHVLAPSTSNSSFVSASSGSSANTHYRRRSQSVQDLRDRAMLAPLREDSSSGLSADVFLTPRQSRQGDESDMEVLEDESAKPVPVSRISLSRSDAAAAKRESVDWGAFSQGGFSTSTSEGELSLAEIDIKPLASSYDSQTVPARRSMRRRGSIGASLGRRKSSRGGIPNFSGVDEFGVPKPRPAPTYTVTSVSMEAVDTALTTVWQDQLLDHSLCCALPAFIFVQLDEKAAAEADLLGGAEERPWLLINELVIPPRPPTPEERTRRNRSDGSISDKRSIFAPSIRSVTSQLRRVSSMINPASLRRNKNRTLPESDE